MAGDYASSHADELSGVIMFAAYSRKPLDDRLLLVRVYGSEDGVLSMGKVTENSKNYPSRYIEYLIEGGNHAQFGCYGPQRGDGAATITAEEQQAEAVDAVIRACD